MSEKKVYAMAPEGCETYLKAGKVYLVTREDGNDISYWRDDHTNYGKWIGCGHLNGGNWTRLELTEEEAEAINAKLTDPNGDDEVSEIEWSPDIKFDGGDNMPQEIAGVLCHIYEEDLEEWIGTDGSTAESWFWHDGITSYRIPMDDYRRIYVDPLHIHPQSELDADQYTAGADELQYDPDEVAFDSVNAPSSAERAAQACSERGINPCDAASFLEAALGHMQDRSSTYDAPYGERSMGKTVAAFNAITGHNMSEEQGWLFMVLLKAVRTQQGGFRADNYEDGAAYFGLQGEAAARDRGTCAV